MTEFDTRDQIQLRSAHAPKTLDVASVPHIEREIIIRYDGETVSLYADSKTAVSPRNDPHLIFTSLRELLKK